MCHCRSQYFKDTPHSLVYGPLTLEPICDLPCSFLPTVSTAEMCAGVMPLSFFLVKMEGLASVMPHLGQLVPIRNRLSYLEPLLVFLVKLEGRASVMPHLGKLEHQEK